MVPAVEIVEVGLRDGLQPIRELVPTATKIAFLEAIARAGIRRAEVGSFVSAAAVPQMADTPAVLRAALAIEGLRAQVLVPTARRAEEAVAAGAREIAFVVSASEAHNQANIRRSVAESVEEFRRIAGFLPADVAVRVNVATAFDCPYDGRIDAAQVLVLSDALLAARGAVELCLCDTTGRAAPDQVARLFGDLARPPAGGSLAFHAHDTYGLGVANVLAAHGQGVRVFDASFAGLGGCPFAPGATGNVATEDVVWTFERMGIATGVALPGLLALAEDAARVPGAQPGGRVRTALAAAACTR